MANLLSLPVDALLAFELVQPRAPRPVKRIIFRLADEAVVLEDSWDLNLLFSGMA